MEHIRFGFGSHAGAGRGRSRPAQWGYPGNSGPFGLGYGTGFASGFSPYDYSSFGGPFGPGYGIGTTSGFSPFNYGSFGGGLGYGGFGGIGFSPLPGYAQSTGQRPQTTASYQSASDAVTLSPAGAARRIGFAVDAETDLTAARVTRSSVRGGDRIIVWWVESDDRSRFPYKCHQR